MVLACLVGAALYYPLVYNARADVLAIKGTGGHAGHAGSLFVRYGCAGCHTIPGVRLARGTYGPPLTGLADRARLGGTVENTPENLVRWISRSRDLDPHAGMPNTDASERDARDMAAYLYAR
jgi:cytochrome c1